MNSSSTLFLGFLHPADGRDYYDCLAGYVSKGSDSRGFRRFRSYDSTLAAKSGIVWAFLSDIGYRFGWNHILQLKKSEAALQEYRIPRWICFQNRATGKAYCRNQNHDFQITLFNIQCTMAIFTTAWASSSWGSPRSVVSEFKTDTTKFE